MKIYYRCFVISLTVVLLLCGCSRNSEKGASNSTKADSKQYLDVVCTNDPTVTGIANITSQELQSIDNTLSYGELVVLFGNTKDYGIIGLRVYSVDFNKLLILKFDSLQQVCEKTGKELYDSTIPLNIPSKAVEMSNGSQSTVFGVMLTEHSFFCFQKMESFDLLTENSTVKDITGNNLASENIKPLDRVLLKYDSVMETYPAILKCTDIVVFNS